MKIDKKTFLDSLGGPEAASRMDSEAKADALESHMMAELNRSKTGDGAGFLYVPRTGENVSKLAPMPANPTLVDFFKWRFMDTSKHVLQSANLAMKNGMKEEIILACLLHDVVQEIIRTDHGWWGAQLFEPYVPEKVSFAIRYHQALRYYPDLSVGYEYPDLYRQLFGSDYVPPPYIEATYQMVRKHPWYMEARLVTVNDLYAFDPNVEVTIEPFLDIIGRHFKQPKEGLGNDGSPVAHMWRTIIRPDQPL
jgi:predicted HD phosphohydrolase